MILVLQIAAGVTLGIIGGTFAVVGLVEARNEYVLWRRRRESRWLAAEVERRRPQNE